MHLLRRRLATPGAWRTLVRFDPWGTGLWAVSPVLLIALRRPRREDLPLVTAAGLTILAVAVFMAVVMAGFGGGGRVGWVDAVRR